MKKQILLCIFCFQNILFSLYAQKVTITVWKDSVIGAQWNPTTKTVAYNKKDKEGYYKIFLSDSSGNNEEPLILKDFGRNRHIWVEEWHPSGKYLFCYVEKEEYLPENGHKRAPIDAMPGYGAYTDLWLISRDGLQHWPLTNLPNNYNNGIIHAAISPDGTVFGWSERIQAPKFVNKNLAAGAYVMRIADFTFDSVPRFSNIRTFQPGNVLALNEIEGISNDKSTISFYSTFETKNIFNTPIYTLNIETGVVSKLTTESFAQAPTFSPNGEKIVYMTGKECDIFPFQIQGADWWIMNTDGSNQIRLTYMNKKKHSHSINKYRLAGSISFIDNQSFLGGVMTKPLGLTGYTVIVTFE